MIIGGSINPPESSLEKITRNAGSIGRAALQGATFLYALNGLIPRKNKELEEFLIRKRNPYVANILLKVAEQEAKHNGSSPIHTEHAIDLIETKGLEGVIEVLNNIRSADVWSGGLTKGYYHEGVRRAYNSLGIKPKVHAGSSIGFVSALFMAINNQENKFGLDTSEGGFDRFAHDFASTLGIEGLYNKPKTRYEKLMQLKKGLLLLSRAKKNEGHLAMEPLVKYLQSKLPMKMQEIEGLHITACNYSAQGNNRIVYSDKLTPKEPVWSAAAKTINAPFMFDPFREKDNIFSDGGLVEILPVASAFEEGKADMILATSVDYRIPVAKSSYMGFRGTIEQAGRNLSIQHRAATYWMIKYYTGIEPGELSRTGDPNGKIILFMPDLRHINRTDFFDEGPKLVPIGKNQSLDGLAKFLNPDIGHPKYDPNHFIKLARY